jgi:hypothetical protein
MLIGDLLVVVGVVEQPNVREEVPFPLRPNPSMSIRSI